MCGGGSDDPKQTPEERELGRIAIERWNDYQTRFRPVENDYIEDVRRTDSDYAQARGQATSAVQQAFDPMEDQLRSNLFYTGVSPESTQFLEAMSGMDEDRALSIGTGVNEAETAVSNQHVAGLQGVVAMGQGQSAEALGGMGQVAGDATTEAVNRAYRSFDNRQAGLHLAGTVAGAGANYAMNAPTPGPNVQGQEAPLYNNTAYVKRY